MSEPKKYREFWIQITPNEEFVYVEFPDNDGDISHVVEASALYEAEQKIAELEIQNNDLRNSSHVKLLRSLREVDKMKLDRANEKLEKAEAALEKIEKYQPSSTMNPYKTMAREALKEIRK